MDTKIQEYNQIRHIEFSRLSSLCFKSPIDKGCYEIEIILKDESDRELILFFEGVVGIKFNPTLSIFTDYLDIVSIRDRGWEDINYEVKSQENKDLNFLCKDFYFHLK